MKWILMAIVFTCCVVVGYIFSIKYKKRMLFFSSLVMFAQKLDVEINYSRERLKILIEGIDEKGKKNLLGIDKNFLAYLAGSEELSQEVLFKNISILKNDEKEVVYLFFKSLGRSDVIGQSKEIQSYIKRFEDSSTSAIAENKKYGSLCFKLGIVAGLLAIILLI